MVKTESKEEFIISAKKPLGYTEEFATFLKELDIELDNKIRLINTKLELLNVKIELLETKKIMSNNKINEKIKLIDEKIKAIDEKLGDKLELIDAKLRLIDAKLDEDKFDNQLYMINSKLELVEAKFSQFDSKMKAIKSRKSNNKIIIISCVVWISVLCISWSGIILALFAR